MPLLQRRWPEVAAFGFVPLLLASILPIQLFPPPGWVDPGMYLGYFLNLPVLLERFGPDYHGMRLPWVLSGFVVNRLFPPVLAHFVLIGMFHLIATVSIYRIVTPRHGRLAGLIAPLGLTLNPMWIAAATRGYVDGPGIALALACLASVANLDRVRTVRAAGLRAGLFGGLAVFTHPVAGLMAAAAVCAALAVQRLAWRDALRLIAWAALTALTVAAVLGGISMLAGGPFLFWLVVLDILKRSLSGFGAYYVRPAREWLPTAYWLFPMIGLLVSGLLVLAFRRPPVRSSAAVVAAPARSDASPESALAAVETSASASASAPASPSRADLLIIGCVLLGLYVIGAVVWDVGIGGTLLQSSFTLTFSLPGIALVFAGLVGAALDAPAPHRTGRASVTLFLACVAAGAIPLAGVAFLWSIDAATRPVLLGWVMLTAITLLATAVLCGRIRVIPAIAAPILLLFAVAASGAAHGDTRRLFIADGNPSYGPFYRAEHRVNTFIRRHLKAERALLLWYDRHDFTTPGVRDEWLQHRMRFNGTPLALTIYDSFGAMWLWHRASLGFGMPAFAADAAMKPEWRLPGSVAIFCSTLARCEAAVRALETRGVKARLAALDRIVEAPYIDFTAAIVDIDAVAAASH